MYRLLYIIIIIFANILTACVLPFELSIFIIPAGTVFIGFTFIIRDLLQQKYGKIKTYYYIITALFINLCMSILNRDIFWITMGSTVSFAVSEILDTEIYSKFMYSKFSTRVLYSGVVSSFADSVLFVLIGLSPLTTNIIPWEFIVYAIFGQYFVKAAMQILVGSFIRIFGK